MSLVPMKKRERRGGETGRVLAEMDDLTLAYYEFIIACEDKNDEGGIVFEFEEIAVLQGVKSSPWR